jgi:apolipoprotein N-acyltransferase
MSVSLWFSVSWLAATCWWLVIAMHTYGGMPLLLAVTALLSLSFALSAYYVAAMATFKKISARNLGKHSPELFAALWTLAEVARGTWLSGFGWGGTGYAHLEGPLAAWAPWIGVYGISALTSYCCASLIFGGWSSRLLSVTRILLVLLTMAFNIWLPKFTDSAGVLDVAILQGNIPQNEKFSDQTGIVKALQWYPEQAAQLKQSLVVTPETSIPVLLHLLPNHYLHRFHATDQEKAQTAVLLGMPLGDASKGYTNSVLAITQPETQAWRYDKHHLVPLGESNPPMMRWFTRMMNIPLGDFNQGAPDQAPFSWKGQQIAATICYEDLFTEELAARFNGVQPDPSIWINISNLAWFGASEAMDQHLSISRMRALEFERPFIKASNTGVTAVINHRGEITSRLPKHQAGTLEALVEGRKGLTPYAWWSSQFGLWPLVVLCFLVLVFSVRRHRIQG